ncbi:hypothetical protein EW145_g4438 [Phellinidium pouzarii]|uniref:Uncharacterized protein n=1 Tax=Phellinidium pouzarii TaxID=167371 RepID=A0A4S4L3P7_9AGAM|nr:hypothetical protein EW145_g4438 [Phellinidium pouzarii]
MRARTPERQSHPLAWGSQAQEKLQCQLNSSAMNFIRVESEPSRHTLSAPQLNQGSHSEGQSSSHSQSTSDRLVAHLPRITNHLRRPGSLTALRDNNSAQSLPHSQGRVEIDLNGSDHDRSWRGSALPSVASLQKPLHRVTHSDSYPSRRNSVDSPSNSPSHQPAPLRLFWPLNRIRSREEPFVPVNPYRNHFRLFSAEAFEEEFQRKRAALAHVPPLLRHIVLHAYLNFLLRLPSMYFTRVSHIFEEADVTRPEMQRMIDGVTRGLDLTHDWTPPNVSPALARFKISWEDFVDTVVQEWKTLNVVSALLLSAILTMFQIDDANDQAIVRTASLLSLICATWSLIYGGIYILRFRTMRSMYKASTWAQEAQKTKTNILWNVWVLLALPAVWLAWSMIGFFVAILAFVWTSGSSADNPEPPSRRVEIGPRVLISAFFVLGLAYFALIIREFKSYNVPRTRVRGAGGDTQDASRQPNGRGGREPGPPNLRCAAAAMNSLGLNLGGEAVNGNARFDVNDALREPDLEKGNTLVDDQRRRGRGTPGLGLDGLGF